MFAKCPIPGRCKTRISPLLNEYGAASLATAMLSDILVSLTACVHLKETLKVLVYAPGSSEGEAHMKSILLSLNLSVTTIVEGSSFFDGWVLLPMALGADLTSTLLGSKLEDALDKTRKLLADAHNLSPVEQKNNETVLFIGMDAPEISLEEIVYGLTCRNKAHMCPAGDGGYGLLSVPRNAPSSQIFSGVRWSNKLTAVSQLKALSDCNIDISIGKIMNDVDEPDDVIRLAKRLICSRGGGMEDEHDSQADVLESLSSGIWSAGRYANAANGCEYTWRALLSLNVITKSSDGYCINKKYNLES